MKNFSSILLIFAGLAAGMLLRLLSERGKINLGKDPAATMRKAQTSVLTYIVPVTNLLAIWIAEVNSIKYLWLPFMGMITSLVSMAIAWFTSKLGSRDAAQRAAMFATSGLANMGSIGGVVIFMCLGEAALAYQPLFLIMEKPMYMAVSYPLIKMITQGEVKFSLKPFAECFKEKMLIALFMSIIAGLILNLCGVKRPEVFTDINAVAVPASTFVLLCSVGWNMKFALVKKYWKLALSCSAVKLVIIPVVITLITLLTPLTQMAGGVPAKVAVILSAMPTAFLAIVGCNLYGGDVDTANAVFMVATACVVVTVPLWITVINLVF